MCFAKLHCVSSVGTARLVSKEMFRFLIEFNVGVLFLGLSTAVSSCPFSFFSCQAIGLFTLIYNGFDADGL